MGKCQLIHYLKGFCNSLIEMVWKRKFIIFIIFIKFISFGIGDDSKWFNNLWKYRREIIIDNKDNAKDLTDYQILINLDTENLISVGKMRKDCGDIRFTDTDGKSLLNHWIESGIDSSNTKIWVKIPKIPAFSEKKIYLYYGNLSANCISNGDNTFDFFDDFSGNEIDTKKWRIIDSSGFSILNGELKGTNTRGQICSIKVFSSPIIQEVKLRVIKRAPNGETVGGFWAGIDKLWFLPIKGFTILEHQGITPKWPDGYFYIWRDGVWEIIGKQIPEKQNVLLRVIGFKDKVKLTIINLDSNSEVYNNTFNKSISEEMIMLGRRPDDKFVGQRYEVYWDWILIRKFSEKEPKIVIMKE